MTPDLPDWAIRIRALRHAHGWSQTTAVDRLRAGSSTQLPEAASILRRWKAWESGKSYPDEFYRPLVAAALGTVTSSLFPPPRGPDSLNVLAGTGMDTMEILGRLQLTDISRSTIEALDATVDALCTRYAFDNPSVLIAEAGQWLGQLVDLQDRHLTFAQRQETLRLAGYLTLLVGCIEYDQGDQLRAESTRRAAMRIGAEVGSPDIVGWAHEIKAWMSLTNQDYRATLAAAREGQAAAGQQSVAVQLIAQEAKALARMGLDTEMQSALERGRVLLDSLPYPDNTRNHFVVDPAKFDFYAMDCYRKIGNDTLATALADGVIRTATDFTGTEVAPMRVAEARITLAVAAARDGDLSVALNQGQAALKSDRRSLPSLLTVAADLTDVLNDHYHGHGESQAFIDHVRHLATVSS